LARHIKIKDLLYLCMTYPFFIQFNDKQEVTGKRNIKALRSYGEILLVVLFVMHLMAFAAFRLVERDAIRIELQEYARQFPTEGFGDHADKISRFPDGIIVLRSDNNHEDGGFYETHIGHNELYVYEVPYSNLIVAKSEDSLEYQLLNVGFIIGILYIVEVFVLLGWWFFLQEKIKQLFFPN